MADLGMSAALMDDEEKKRKEAQLGAQSAQGGSSGVVAGGAPSVSTAGVGAGGTGGWTNIQAYLGANKQDTGTAGYLNSKIGSKIDQEENTLNQKATEAKTQAQTQASQMKDVSSKAGDYVNQATKAYQWDNQTQNDAYSGARETLQKGLSSQYTGPQGFSYNLAPELEKEAGNLKDNQSFGQMLENSYRERAGKPMNSGQLALQRQFDTTNDQLANTRQNLLSRYAGLGDKVNSTVTETDQAVKQAGQDFASNQAALRDFLTNQASTLDQNINEQEAKARADYQAALNAGSGFRFHTMDEIDRLTAMDPNSTIGDSMGLAGNIDAFKNQGTSTGLWKDNLSFDELQREQDLFNSQYAPGDALKFGLADRKNALDKFYQDQDSKFGNVADEEERKWNFIQDVMGNTSRKAKGFKVRG